MYIRKEVKINKEGVIGLSGVQKNAKIFLEIIKQTLAIYKSLGIEKTLEYKMAQRKSDGGGYEKYDLTLDELLQEYNTDGVVHNDISYNFGVYLCITNYYSEGKDDYTSETIVAIMTDATVQHITAKGFECPDYKSSKPVGYGCIYDNSVYIKLFEGYNNPDVQKTDFMAYILHNMLLSTYPKETPITVQLKGIHGDAEDKEVTFKDVLELSSFFRRQETKVFINNKGNVIVRGTTTLYSEPLVRKESQSIVGIYKTNINLKPYKI